MEEGTFSLKQQKNTSEYKLSVDGYISCGEGLISGGAYNWVHKWGGGGVLYAVVFGMFELSII